MKVIHIVHNYYGYSGATLQAKNLAKEINNNQKIHQVFFTRNNDALTNTELQDDTLNVVATSGGVKRAVDFAMLCFRFKPQIAHFHGADFLLLIICKIFGIRTYWKSTLLGSDDFASLCGKGFRGFIKKKLLSLININNALTQQMYDINRKFIRESRLVIIPNGVELPDLETCSVKDKSALIVSALIPRKGIIEGIDFYKNNLEKLGYKLHVIGPNHAGLEGYDDAYANECLRYSSGNIIFEGGLSHDQVKSFLARARFLIHLSKKEGMPNVVLEALAYGLVPIIDDMDGLSNELLKSEQMGYNVKNGIFHEDSYSLINVDARDYIHHNIGFPIIAKKTLCIYNMLLKK